MNRFPVARLRAACLVLLGIAGPACATVLDTFDASEGWQATHTDDVVATLHMAPGTSGQAVCLRYDFNGVSGAASLRRTLPIDFPDGFALSFDAQATCRRIRCR